MFFQDEFPVRAKGLFSGTVHCQFSGVIVKLFRWRSWGWHDLSLFFGYPGYPETNGSVTVKMGVFPWKRRCVYWKPDFLVSMLVLGRVRVVLIQDMHIIYFAA